MPAPNRKTQNALKRSAARLAAVQVVYSMDITGIGATQALDEMQERLIHDPAPDMPAPDANLTAFLVHGVTADAEELERLVGQALSREWTVDRLEAVLSAILKVGAFELKARVETPVRVIISEYVDVAHAFYSGPEPGLVNAVMDRVGRVLRPGEFNSPGGEGRG